MEVPWMGYSAMDRVIKNQRLVENIHKEVQGYQRQEKVRFDQDALICTFSPVRQPKGVLKTTLLDKNNYVQCKSNKAIVIDGSALTSGHGGKEMMHQMTPNRCSYNMNQWRVLTCSNQSDKIWRIIIIPSINQSKQVTYTLLAWQNQQKIYVQRL